MDQSVAAHSVCLCLHTRSKPNTWWLHICTHFTIYFAYDRTRNIAVYWHRSRVFVIVFTFSDLRGRCCANVKADQSTILMAGDLKCSRCSVYIHCSPQLMRMRAEWGGGHEVEAKSDWWISNIWDRKRDKFVFYPHHDIPLSIIHVHLS